ncbi:NAD(P)/FAD-dependent oxidoreductase [Inmirania thermothiophila]|uniref:Glycine/D-amino acid oxidase-like deaminating enzyme n=1 Tax=Inmirania thermothiophila TaxID=1750597 RepID=A0A3N1Y0C4_9GAMM|nr:FAD-binding oxidoreductase [Inmirania thermothiophila]ROR32303.1 glycine/D-amino acid oxidase-like deaminating enzyme [Inmirania thermothiophila]
MHREPALQDALWWATAPPAPAAPPLEGEAEADVAVVGAGYTGCSAALHLAGAGCSVVLLEARCIGWGGSGRNIGLVNAGLWLDPDEVERRAGPRHGPRLVEALGAAPRLVFALIERHRIACEAERRPVARAAHDRRALARLQAHARQWQRRGAAVEVIDARRTAELTGARGYAGGILDHRSGTVQPLAYARGLAAAAARAGARVHEATPVLRLAPAGDGWRLETPRGTVRAGRVLLAGNAYAEGALPGLDRATVPVGCFACAGPLPAEAAGIAAHAFYDTRPAMLFARRDAAGHLLLGSLGRLPADGAEAWLRRAWRLLFPGLAPPRWRHRWAGTLGFTPGNLPRLHQPAPGLYAVLGYNGRGIGPGTLWGRLLAQWILGACGADDLPLPVTALRPVPARALRAAAWEFAFRAARLAHRPR